MLATIATALADPVIASAQQTLKDQGFYYGDISGNKDADTSAAIRRYQIRNGLQVTGELNPETQKSLGLKSSRSSAPPRSVTTPPPTTSRSTPPPVTPRPDTSDLRDDYADQEDPPAQRGVVPRQGVDRAYPPEPGYGPEPRSYAPGSRAVFPGTPYEIAPPEVQRRVIAAAQALLTRRGYYRSGVDGLFGAGTELAIRAYQSDVGLEPSGRLDMETLAELGLLPGRQGAGRRGSGRRIWRRPPVLMPPNERVYIPR